MAVAAAQRPGLCVLHKVFVNNRESCQICSQDRSRYFKELTSEELGDDNSECLNIQIHFLWRQGIGLFIISEKLYTDVKIVLKAAQVGSDVRNCMTWFSEMATLFFQNSGRSWA